jgi:AcrR family transcriptional regulator
VKKITLSASFMRMARRTTLRANGQHHGDLKRSLLKTATELVEAGNVEFSLRELARQAGVTPAAPYHHFTCKTAVLDEIATTAFANLDAALTAAVAKTATPSTQLTQLLRAYLSFASAHQAHYQLMFPPGLGTADVHTELRSVAETAFARLLNAVRLVRTDATEEDLALWAFSVWALCHGFLGMQRDGLLAGEVPFGPFERIMPKIARLCAELVDSAGRTPRR